MDTTVPPGGLKERRRQARFDQWKRKVYPLYVMLKMVFEQDEGNPKALGRAVGKPGWWARRRLKKAT